MNIIDDMILLFMIINLIRILLFQSWTLYKIEMKFFLYVCHFLYTYHRKKTKLNAGYLMKKECVQHFLVTSAVQVVGDFSYVREK